MKMPKPDPDSSQQNAFVQDWLLKWADQHTVHGTDDWIKAAQEKIDSNPTFATTWRMTVKREVEDAEKFDHMIEMLQGTYSYEQHMEEDARETFNGRLRDINVEEVLWMGDGFQINGTTTDGKKVWMMAWVRGNATFRLSNLANDTENY